MLNIVICDDDRVIVDSIAEAIKKALKSHNINGDIVCATTDVEEAEEWADKANVFFLDIHFNRQNNGIELAGKIRESNQSAYIIFITGFAEYAIQCFKVFTFDFIEKPVKQFVIEDTLLKVNRHYVDCHQEMNVPHIRVKSGSVLYTVKNADIVYIERLGQKSVVHTKNQSLSLYDSLDNLVERLDDKNFFRTHKSFLVNKAHIKYVDMQNRKIYLDDGSVCELGVRHKRELEEII